MLVIGKIMIYHAASSNANWR